MLFFRMPPAGRILKTFVLVTSLVVSAQAAHALPEEYEIEKPHTQIMFSVNHLGYSNSYGKFTDHQGTLIFDRDNPAESSVSISIPVASLEINDQKWNDHLKGPDFFDVEKFPVMTFKSTAITVTGENTGDITGDLTLHGVTKPVTLRTTFNKADRHPMGEKYVAGFSATATLKRSDFGMSYGIPMVGDDVNLIIEVEAIRKDQPGQEPLKP